MAVPHFLRTFNVPLFVPLPYFIRSHFVNFSTRRNCKKESSILAAIFCRAIFNTAIHFIAVQPAISRLFIQSWTLSCRFCSGPVVAIFILLLAKDVFVATTSRRPIFFVALLVVVLVIFTPSCCSYCHCSTSSNSYTVLLSKPASYSPALFSVRVKICEHAYQSFVVVYGTEKVRQLCGYTTLVGAVKVRLRYCGSTWKVRRTYG